MSMGVVSFLSAQPTRTDHPMDAAMDQVTDRDRRELDSLNMGIEDYTLCRMNRRDNAPCPVSYQEGWDEAAAEARDREDQQHADAAEYWGTLTAYDMDPDTD